MLDHWSWCCTGTSWRCSHVFNRWIRLCIGNGKCGCHTLRRAPPSGDGFDALRNGYIDGLLHDALGNSILRDTELLRRRDDDLLRIALLEVLLCLCLGVNEIVPLRLSAGVLRTSSGRAHKRACRHKASVTLLHELAESSCEPSLGPPPLRAADRAWKTMVSSCDSEQHYRCLRVTAVKVTGDDDDDHDEDDDDACLAIFFRGPHQPEARKQGVTLWRLLVTLAWLRFLFAAQFACSSGSTEILSQLSLVLRSRSGLFGQTSKSSNGLHQGVSKLSRSSRLRSAAAVCPHCLPFAHGQSHSLGTCSRLNPNDYGVLHSGTTTCSL